MNTVTVLIWAMILLCPYLAVAMLYIHKPHLSKMDFCDLARRVGPPLIYVAMALSATLLMLRVAPEWRLPPVVLAVALTAVGVTRDVIRERKRRKANPHG